MFFLHHQRCKHHTQILNIKLRLLVLLHFISTHHCTCHSMNQGLVRQKADGQATVVGHLCSFSRSDRAQSKHREVTVERPDGGQLVVGPVFQAVEMAGEFCVFTATTPSCFFKLESDQKGKSDMERKLSRNASCQSPFIGRAKRQLLPLSTHPPALLLLVRNRP